MQGDSSQLTLEERRLRLEERRLNHDNSFAKKWLPTFATVMVGLIAALFGYIQHLRSSTESQMKDEREWGLKVVEMYFNKREELFDITNNPITASANLSVLAVVAPTAVQGVLNAEKARIPPPKKLEELDDPRRLNSLIAANGVQDALAAAVPSKRTPNAGFKPSGFTVYIQYAAGDKEVASKTQGILTKLGYRSPGFEEVSNVPQRLEVRFYRPEQESFARDLASKLNNELDLPPSSAAAAVLFRSAKQLPEGILEVWLPLRKN